MSALRLLLACVLLAGAALSARAQSNAGTSGAQFLKIGAGGRAGAMGDAFTAVADDVYASYYNPAGLIQLKGAQLGGAHAAYFQDVSYDVLSFAYPFGRGDQGMKNALSLSVYHLGVGDIDRRVGDSTDAIGQFGASDDAYALSYARALNGRVSVGATGKFISQTLDSYRASSFAGDVGVLYRLNPEGDRPVALGASIRNLGPGTGYVKGHEDPLPTGGVVGVSYKHSAALTLDLDAGKFRDADPFAAVGGEWRKPFSPETSASLRAGYTSARRDLGALAGLSAGVGLTYNRASFDFAWQPFGALGNTFRYSLLVKF